MLGFRNALCRYVINTRLTLIQCPGTSLVPQYLNRVSTHNCLCSNACVAWSRRTSAVSSAPPSRPKILPHSCRCPPPPPRHMHCQERRPLRPCSMRVVWPGVNALCSANSNAFVRQHQDWRGSPLGQRPMGRSRHAREPQALTEGIGPAVFRLRVSNLPGRP